MKVDVREFLNKYRTVEYRHGIYIPEDIYIRCSRKELDILLKGDTDYFIELPDDIYNIIEENKNKDK